MAKTILRPWCHSATVRLDIEVSCVLLLSLLVGDLCNDSAVDVKGVMVVTLVLLSALMVIIIAMILYALCLRFKPCA